jgi:hypothetical protein
MLLVLHIHDMGIGTGLRCLKRGWQGWQGCQVLFVLVAVGALVLIAYKI